MTRYYHGGVPGLEPGQLVLPPGTSGHGPSCGDLDPQHCRRDRVYVAGDEAEAAVYAAMFPWGTVYEVEPQGELKEDAPPISYAAESALVVDVLLEHVPPDYAQRAIRNFLALLERHE